MIKKLNFIDDNCICVFAYKGKNILAASMTIDFRRLLRGLPLHQERAIVDAGTKDQHFLFAYSSL
jgi:hypothetical protein